MRWHPPSTAALRTAGVGCGLLIVVLVYTPAGFGDAERVWAAAVVLADRARTRRERWSI